MTRWAIDRFQDQFLAHSIKILVLSTGTVASVDFCFVDGVERANGASSLEGELSTEAGQGTNSTTIFGVSFLAATLIASDDLVSSTGEAIALTVQQFITLTLTHAKRTLKSLSLRTSA